MQKKDKARTVGQFGEWDSGRCDEQLGPPAAAGLAGQAAKGGVQPRAATAVHDVVVADTHTRRHSHTAVNDASHTSGKAGWKVLRHAEGVTGAGLVTAYLPKGWKFVDCQFSHSVVAPVFGPDPSIQ